MSKTTDRTITKGTPVAYDDTVTIHPGVVEEVVHGGQVLLARTELGLAFFNRRRDGRYVKAGDSVGVLTFGTPG